MKKLWQQYKELDFYAKVGIWGGLIFLITGYAKEYGIFNGTFKTFKFDGELYEYKYWELIVLLGQLAGQLCWASAIRHSWRTHKIVRCTLQWYIDLIMVDVFFVIKSNPFDLDQQKTISFLISAIIFVLIYIFEEVLLLKAPNPFLIKSTKHEKNIDSTGDDFPVRYNKSADKGYNNSNRR